MLVASVDFDGSGDGPESSGTQDTLSLDLRRLSFGMGVFAGEGAKDEANFIAAEASVGVAGCGGVAG